MSRRRLLVALSAAVLVAACSGAPDDLEGWLVGSAFRADPGAAGSQHPPIVEGSLIEVRFGAGTLSATGGCNDMVGRRVVEGAALVLPDGLASTERACDSGLMAQDDWVAALLESRPELVVEEDGRRLIVTGEHMLVLVRRDPAPIAGTVWRLSAIGDVGPDGSVSVVDGSSTLEITAGQGGEDLFEVRTGCPGGGSLGADGPVMVGEGQLEFQDAEPSEDDCADPFDPLMAEVMGLLVGTVDYRISGDLMVLTSDGVDLHYTAQR